MAWGIIANAYNGDWNKAIPDWQTAAARWRDEVWSVVCRKKAHGDERVDIPKKEIGVISSDILNVVDALLDRRCRTKPSILVSSSEWEAIRALRDAFGE
jgi:hypothetical protein